MMHALEERRDMSLASSSSDSCPLGPGCARNRVMSSITDNGVGIANLFGARLPASRGRADCALRRRVGDVLPGPPRSAGVVQRLEEVVGDVATDLHPEH